jgi:diguanylate cyclase (GGDEF)-like protein
MWRCPQLGVAPADESPNYTAVWRDGMDGFRVRRSMLLVLVGGIALLIFGISVALAGRAGALGRERHALAQRSQQQAAALDEYAARAASIILITAHNPAFGDFYQLPGDRAARVSAGGNVVDEANDALGYLEQLYPDSIGEACFIDDTGAEIARMVRGERAAVADLSLEEAQQPFFAPSFALPPGTVYHAKPYLSPDTDEWVIANATLVPTEAGRQRAIVHFEVTVESFRRHAVAQGTAQLLVVDADTGTVVINSAQSQQIGAPLGDPGDTRFAALTKPWADSGHFEMDGRQGAYHRVAGSPTNANDWYAVALAPGPTGLLTGVGTSTLITVVLALLLIGYATWGLRQGRSVLVAAANTDPLTGLLNRRRLVADLDRQLNRVTTQDPLLLMLCDLNGFKTYNDTFGHPAGDALLARLGTALATATAGRGLAYRIGGDEFCVLARPGRDGVAAIVTVVTEALSEHGDGFTITTSHGAILLPDEARHADEAMRLVDLRMYEQKNSGRVPADTQAANALLRALRERDAGLAERLTRTAHLAGAVAQQMGLGPEEQARISRAAQLHDVGKVAVPDEILSKAEPLDATEWAFLQHCPAIGERITAAAPALASLAPLIKAAREHFDGTGYPDGLIGDAAPLGSRIILACAALVAMTSDRPYAPTMDLDDAMVQIHQAAGNQLDPRVTAALLQHLTTPVPVPGDRASA